MDGQHLKEISNHFIYFYTAPSSKNQRALYLKMKIERNEGNFQCSIIKMVVLIQLEGILSKLSSIRVDKVSYTFSLSLFT